jgi:hypothetical protein
MAHTQFAVDDAETTLLRQVLERAISSLREEIGKTENYQMRQELKADESRLKAMLARLPAA